MKWYILRYLYLQQQWQWACPIGDVYDSHYPFMDVDEWTAGLYWDDSEIIWS